MNETADHEQLLERSWRANADAWSDAVREQRIASRRAGTDAAIIDAVLHTNARRVLDLGCGEGWLARALSARGCEVVGVDGSPELIAAALALGGARFEVASYAELAARGADFGHFDTVVCNFALLGADLHTPLRAARGLLHDDGALIVQTASVDRVRRRAVCRRLARRDVRTFRGRVPHAHAVVLPHAGIVVGGAAPRRIRSRTMERADGSDQRRPLSLLIHARPVAAEAPP